MPKVLGLGFKGFGCLANSLTEADKGISEAVRIEVGQTRVGKGFTEDYPNGSGRIGVRLRVFNITLHWLN